MERYKKKDMLQTVDTLLKANDAIVRTLTSNPQGAAEALVQCQESAIMLGTYIDTLDEKFAPLVHMLEDYCENIYQMSENLSDENLCRKYAKKIQKQLTGLRNGIKYDLPDDKKEVVFLPYKASMWDSLESIWKAADEDPNCDAYVIPIPYFDKNPDGSFREEHYEGNLYPKYVPITRYDEYDLEAQHPDVIYIHNPYDECNHVTSVHPYFYSKNLRNYTDKLVYISYFILGEIEPDNQKAIDGMKHFCFTPGTIYAHQVILQSENMRQIYINEYMKAAKEMGLPGEHVDRKALEKKFLGTGSPKIDKVLNTRKEDLEVPTEWLRIIEKPDGSRKKIVFYNTSVSALLKHSEKMLRKMESVFEIFRENKDEVALLWRPHPLIQATIESMRPQLWGEYKEIRDRYIEEGWGIYDDSADLDRAVIISDAYYGDGSSVVQLYKQIQKPIMFQNVKTVSASSGPLNEQFIGESGRTNAQSYRLTIEALDVGENEIYAVGRELNVMFRLDLKSDSVKIMMDMPGEDRLVGRLYNGVCASGNMLMLIPYNARRVWYYRLEQKKWDSVDIGKYVDPELSGKFVGGYLSDGIAFLFGYRYKNILLIDLNLQKIKELLDKKEEHSFWAQTPIIHNNRLYVVQRFRNEIVSINLHKIGEYEILKIDNTEDPARNGNVGIAFDGDYFYIIKHHGNLIYKWKPFEKACPIKIDEIFETDEPFFNGGVAFNRTIFLYSPKGKDYICNFDEQNSSFMMENKTFFARSSPHVGLILGGKGEVTVLDNEMREIHYFSTSLNENEHEKYLADSKMSKKALSENDIIGLRDFIFVVNCLFGED